MNGVMYGTTMYNMVVMTHGMVYGMVWGVMYRRMMGLCRHRHSGDS
jgi:hypothetical protein